MRNLSTDPIVFNIDMYEVIPTRNVHMGDDSIVEAIGMGSILVEVMVKGQTNRIRIKDVLRVPKLHANLLSVSKILSSGCKVQFNMNVCIVRAFDGEVIVIALRDGNLYQVTFTKVCEMHVANVAQTSIIDGALELWHRRLGHLNIKGVHALQNMVSGMNLGNMPCPTSSFVCEGCIEGKQHRKPFPSDGGMRATKPLEIVHSDVCGPMRTTSLGGARYFVMYIDDFSRKVWVYLLKSKGECLEKFKEFKALVEKQSEYKIKVFRSNNGGEYISKGFHGFLKAHGIEKQTSTPYRPQENGLAERANCNLVEMTRSMLHAQNLKKSLWAEVVVNAAYTRNRCPSRALPSITPEEAWSGRKPCISHMRVLDALRMPWCRTKRGVSLMQRAQNACFLGIVRAPRHIGLCVCNPKRSSSVGMLSSWRITLVSPMIWRCVQVGEMRPLMW
jgi:transposase InsO family protein